MATLAPVPFSRRLGGSDIVASTLAWGMWRLQGDDVAATRRLIETALAAGITLFDTADIYGAGTPAGFGSAEALFGRVLVQSPALRERMVLATKGGIVPGLPYDSSAPHLEAAIDASLRRLHTERIDLWQIHRPDLLTHPQEIARVIEKARAQGKIMALGVSNFTPAQTRALMAHVPANAVATTQPELSALCLDALTDGTLDLGIEHDIAVLAWSPLGGGRVAAPRTPREHAVAAALDEVATAHSVSRAAAAYSWIMAHPARPIPIVGSQNAARIREAVDAYKVRWTRASWYQVLVASRQQELP